MAAIAAGGAVGGVFAVTGHSSAHSSVSLSASSHRVHHPREMRMARGWSFSKLNNSNDPTFNQLLGINNRRQIGYFGSGEAGHPNKDTCGLRPSSSFANENFPGGIQTQVIGINDTRVTVGFWSTQNTKSQTNNNFGFYDWHRHSHSVSSRPATMRSPRSTSSSVEELRHRGGLLRRGAGQQPRLRVQHPRRLVPPDRDPRRGQLDRIRHQQPRRRAASTPAAAASPRPSWSARTATSTG